MDRREFVATFAFVAVALTAPEAFARFMGRAFLDHAVPGVGLTVNGPVREVRLFFSIGVVAASSRVEITNAAGRVMAAGKPVNDPSDQSVLVFGLARALPAGTYKVRWYAVSVHQRWSSGAFRFTVT